MGTPPGHCDRPINNKACSLGVLSCLFLLELLDDLEKLLVIIVAGYKA